MIKINPIVILQHLVNDLSKEIIGKYFSKLPKSAFVATPKMKFPAVAVQKL